MKRRYSQLLIGAGVMLFFFGTMFNLEIYNTIMVHNCDTKGSEWFVAYEGSGVNADIDFNDKTEGLGSLEAVFTETWPYSGYIRLDTRSSNDWSSTPYFAFDFKTSVTATTTRLKLQTHNGTGYEYATYAIPTTTTDWENKEIDLLSPAQGPDAVNLNAVNFIWWEWYDQSGVRSWNLDNIRRGTSTSGPTPSPTPPAPTPTPPPSPTATPTPGPSAISASISPSSTSITQGQTQTFNCTATGGSLPYTYQWFLNNSEVASAATYTTSASLAIGQYPVYCQVSDSASATVASNIASLTVLSATPQSGNGFLEVRAYVGTIIVDAQIQVASTTFGTGLQGGSVELPIGNYTVTATYESQTLQQTVTISEGQTTKIAFNFTEQQQQPTIGFPFNYLQIIGLGCVGIGGIDLFRQKRKK